MRPLQWLDILRTLHTFSLESSKGIGKDFYIRRVREELLVTVVHPLVPRGVFVIVLALEQLLCSIESGMGWSC